MRRGFFAVSLLFPPSIFGGGAALAQNLERTRAGIDYASRAPAAQAQPTSIAVPHAGSQAFVPAASALVPGLGQLLLRQRRAAAYLALEAVGVGVFVVQMRDGRRGRDRYRELSLSARANYSPTGPRGSWDYYERMEKFVESGAFDAVPGGDLDPEPDVASYNGSVWLLARETYWRDSESPPPPASAEHQAALRFYENRAVTQALRWSWTASPEAFQKYKAAIAASNGGFRRAEQTVSLILANHILSAVDAYVSVRMRVSRAADGSISLTGRVPFRALARAH